MDKVWQRYVKVGMRSQNLLDLHDYYDFHRNRKQLSTIIQQQIIDGKYRPKPPLIIRLEKKYGICRHIQIPTPEDALILQTIVENMAPLIKNASVSERAYYSRSHGTPKNESEIDESFPYVWWELWPAFQKRIYEFSSTFNYIVVTDIANFYDYISFNQLRNVLSSFGQFDECLLDFLFYMLDYFIWKPDYLPLSGFGLPQVNFDAPRILGHAFLFEIDKYLDKYTNGNFVRWMDDIDFAVNDIDQAKDILRGLDELLLTRGLRLNIGKTKILSSAEAKDYFLPDENRYLNIMSKKVNRLTSKDIPIEDEKKLIRRRFKKFLNRPHVGRWEKVYNRYFSISGKTKDTFLEKYTLELLKNNPDMRSNILRYFTDLGPNKKRFEQIRNFYLSKHCFDDTAIFSTAKTLVEWEISAQSVLRKEIVELALMSAAHSPNNFLASVWLLAKYGSNLQLAKLVNKSPNIWKYSSFISRQVAAVVPRIRDLNTQFRFLEKTLFETAQMDAIRIINHLNEFRIKQPLSPADKLYILHGKEEIRVYPLGKFLIAYDLINCKKVKAPLRDRLRTEIIQRISDPIYINELNKIKL